jgi:hypothetical protein
MKLQIQAYRDNSVNRTNRTARVIIQNSKDLMLWSTLYLLDVIYIIRWLTNMLNCNLYCPRYVSCTKITVLSFWLSAAFIFSLWGRQYIYEAARIPVKKTSGETQY